MPVKEAHLCSICCSFYAINVVARDYDPQTMKRVDLFLPATTVDEAEATDRSSKNYVISSTTHPRRPARDESLALREDDVPALVATVPLFVAMWRIKNENFCHDCLIN